MSRFAFAIYCDDIRQEVGNKVSFIGVYNKQLFMPAIPALLPKVCVAGWARTLIEEPFKSVKLRLYANEKTLVEQDLPIPDESDVEPPRNVKLLPGDTAPMQFQILHFAIQLSPFPVAEPTVLRLRLQTEKEELRAGGLSIELAPKQ